MGDMADFALERGFDEIAELEEYMTGSMSDGEAYERGILNESGSLVGDAYTHLDDNLNMQTMEELNREIMYWEGELMSGNSSHMTFNISPKVQLEDDFEDEEHPHLNKAAIDNLYKERPTCNICENPMFTRQGKYGKFYHCHCEDQKNVSDEYWQKIRRYKEECEDMPTLTAEQVLIKNQADEIFELKAKLKRHIHWYGDLR